VASANSGLRLDTYDRFFPNQDTIPKGGFGNLMALPLQKERRAHGFTEFVDESLCPYPDQWKLLSEIHRIGKEEITAILEQCLEADITPESQALVLEETILEQSNAATLELPALPDWNRRSSHEAQKVSCRFSRQSLSAPKGCPPKDAGI
jgi:hypothetical protein